MKERLKEIDQMYGFIEANEFTIKMKDYEYLRHHAQLGVELIQEVKSQSQKNR
jgi:hypothetical protein